MTPFNTHTSLNLFWKKVELCKSRITDIRIVRNGPVPRFDVCRRRNAFLTNLSNRDQRPGSCHIRLKSCTWNRETVAEDRSTISSLHSCVNSLFTSQSISPEFSPVFLQECHIQNKWAHAMAVARQPVCRVNTHLYTTDLFDISWSSMFEVHTLVLAGSGPMFGYGGPTVLGTQPNVQNYTGSTSIRRRKIYINHIRLVYFGWMYWAQSQR